MKYIRTKDGRILDLDRIKLYAESYSFNDESETHLSVEWDIIREEIDIIAQADTVEELCDEIVLIENGNEHNIVYLQEGYDRIIEYHEEGNYEPRLIGRIKVDLDKKAIAEWKENKQGLYDWVLL